jgi:hypothetical protein
MSELREDYTSFFLLARGDECYREIIDHHGLIGGEIMSATQE